jgi:hypothetical protein
VGALSRLALLLAASLRPRSPTTRRGSHSQSS